MASFGKLLSSLNTAFKFNQQTNIIISRTYAARKGTREKARKKKVKVEVKKIGFIPHNQRGKAQLDLLRQSNRFNDSWKQTPVDDVWSAQYNKSKVYTFEEAVSCHRETHHPTMYNVPNAPLIAKIELDMRAEKKNRFIDNISRICPIPYPFQHGDDRTILVFAKGSELQDEAKKAGATLVGGSELIKDIQNGDLMLQEFQYTIAHPNILPELVSLRGLMKKRFPNPKNGTLGPDISNMIHNFLTGIKYNANKDEREQDYAAVNAVFGTLNMETIQLEENLIALLKDVDSAKPRRNNPFITRCYLLSPPSREKFIINLEQYIDSSENTNKSSLSDENEEEEEPAEKTAVN
ncbi:50S ribosomal protein L1 [Chrysoperla carnea]|uniref:50S ribosomal protein L1 n=1 Tax=Chrysoperla carnea TaxID=189513 RepID=UPI001D05F081|nr:50S ribosomal protein L1 [Chrysoperla carnea]